MDIGTMVETITVYLSGLSFFAIFLRLSFSAIAGALVGYDRTVKRRPAGIKTHALLCLSSCLVMITSQYLAVHFNMNDLARIPAQVISGIGFLGAGTILVTRNSQVKGLTTAAGLWYAACLGLAIGIGFFSGAIISLFLLFIIVKFVSKIDRYFYKHSRFAEFKVYTTSNFRMQTFLELINESKCEIISFEDVEDVVKNTYQVALFIPKNQTHHEVLERLQSAKEVIQVIEIIN